MTAHVMTGSYSFLLKTNHKLNQMANIFRPLTDSRAMRVFTVKLSKFLKKNEDNTYATPCLGVQCRFHALATTEPL